MLFKKVIAVYSENHTKPINTKLVVPQLVKKYSAWERRENCTKFWWGSPTERDHSEDQGVGGRMVSE
jgi:hypothetical protein